MRHIPFLLYIICLSFIFNLPTNLRAEVVKKIVIEGVGSNIDKAIRNAAERALMQVVGVYVDSETMISKRKQIKDGVYTIPFMVIMIITLLSVENFAARLDPPLDYFF